MNIRPVLFSAILLLAGIPASLTASTQVNGTLYSPSMQKEVNYSLRIPISYDWYKSRIFPVLYALHGSGAPYTTWTVMNPLNSAIDNNYPAIIAAFEGENSFFLDVDSARQFTTFFFEEFVPFVETEYRAGRYPGRRAVTGFSMGGFGAWHYMLEDPAFFSSVSALSGAYDYSPFGQTDKNPYNRIPQYAASNVDLPPMYMNCGTLDWLLPDQRDMVGLLTTHGYTFEAYETEGYNHEWAFWRDTSDEVITFHYQYFEEPPTEWRGFPIIESSFADAGPLGMVYFALEPWVWLADHDAWAAVGDDFDSDDGGWIYIPAGAAAQ